MIESRAGSDPEQGRVARTRARIRQAAMEVVARRGFDATVDEIAELSGVSARTIFRHYLTHDRLIAETVKDMFEDCGRYPIDDLPRLTDDLDGWIGALPRHIDDVDTWLEDLAVTIHKRTAQIFGEAFWDIHALKGDESDILAMVASFRREYRLRAVHYLASLAWRSAGGAGDPSDDLVLGFALNLSPFATQALMIDFDQTPEQAGRLTATILKQFLAEAVADQEHGPRDTRRSVGEAPQETGARAGPSSPEAG